LLAADTDALTPHDIANAATWADKYRDANIDNSRQRTRQWHFVDIEVATPNFDAACFNHPPIPSSKPASSGPADDCVADKVQEFAAELANPATDHEEQVVALKFLLHFAFQIAKDDVYGQLPEPNARGSYRLSDDYVTEAVHDVSLQLSKAGARLAFILNQALRKP